MDFSINFSFTLKNTIKYLREYVYSIGDVCQISKYYFLGKYIFQIFREYDKGKLVKYVMTSLFLCPWQWNFPHFLNFPPFFEFPNEVLDWFSYFPTSQLKWFPKQNKQIVSINCSFQWLSKILRINNKPEQALKPRSHKNNSVTWRWTLQLL